MSSISAISVVSEATLASGTSHCLAELPVRVLLQEPSFVDWNEFCSRVESLSPDVLILDYGILRDSIEQTMDRIRTMVRPPSVIVVHTEADADTILRVIRAGAVEYCYSPVEKPLRAALEKIIRQKENSSPIRGKGKVFGFLSAKGGCGSTTIATHLSILLPQFINERVLLADFDLSGGTVAFLTKSKGPYSVVQALQNANRLDDSFWKALVWSASTQLDILPGPSSAMQRQQLPVERLPAVLQFVRHIYGATIVDLGRFLTPAAMAAAAELDRLYVVTTLDVLALHHSSQIVESLLDAGYSRERIGLVVNRVTSQRDIEPEDVQTLLGISINSVLPDDTLAVQEAYREGKLLGSESKLFEHISRLARGIVGLPKENQRKKFLFFGAKQ